MTLSAIRKERRQKKNGNESGKEVKEDNGKDITAEREKITNNIRINIELDRSVIYEDHLSHTNETDDLRRGA